VECNRLGVFWRPLIDMTESPYVAVLLREIIQVADWLADDDGHWSWFAMIGVPGLRRQVVLHAGLEEFDCRRPDELAEGLRSARWQCLVDLLGRFSCLADGTRALLVFHLAQLSFTESVFALTGVVEPNGDPERDRYAYEVARVHSRYPDHRDRSLSAFDALSRSCPDPVLALASAAQGAGHSIRGVSDIALAAEFATRGMRIISKGLPDDWHSDLVRSRFHRAVALLRVAQRDPSGMRSELSESMRFGQAVLAAGLAGPDQLVATENWLVLVQTKIKSVLKRRGDETDAEVAKLSAALAALDPYCVEARSIAGDGYAAAGDYAEAAEQYRCAGQLGTAIGAVAWFRAGQCHDLLGDRAAAINAMGRCLELDASAIEPREYIREHSRIGLAERTPAVVRTGVA
jgi:tetratricopeptide (TPR) repeat protein